MPKREACGVVGAISKGTDVAGAIYYGLIALQHRGQESAGMSVLDSSGIHIHKGMGLAGDVFVWEIISSMKGSLGIGHVRYSTTGLSSSANSQPFAVEDPRSGIVLGHNGNLVNYVELRKKLERSGRRLSSTCDAEVILQMISKEVGKDGDIFNGIKRCMDAFEGAYSVVCHTGEGELVAFRDPLGFRPLCFGLNGGMRMLGSESVALDINGIPFVRDVEPGEVMVLRDDGLESKLVKPCRRRGHCMFEYVYFSRPDSVVNGRSVYDARVELGRNLAKLDGARADIVVPVPDTARPAAAGYAEESGIPAVEGLIKNRYIFRTFIMPWQTARDRAVELKINPMRSVIGNKRVVLVDDSIVRGTTTKRIVRMVKKAGAKEVHVRITCAPIIGPCFYGIDMSTHAELIAANHPVDEIARIIGADSLVYNTIDGIVDSIGLSRGDLCLACLTGEYPTSRAQEMSEKMRGRKRRYWEIEAT